MPPKKTTDTPSNPIADQPATQGIQLTPEELAAIMAARNQTTRTDLSGVPASNVNVKDLVDALVTAITLTKPIEKKTPFNRKRNNPYYPKDGSPRLKLKKRFMQHGIELDEEHLYNEDIEGLNKIKTGIYCSGHVRVIKRKDGAIDIDYPVRTSAQRLKLVNTFGITSFGALIKRINDERADPTKYAQPGDDD